MQRESSNPENPGSKVFALYIVIVRGRNTNKYIEVCFLKGRGLGEYNISTILNDGVFSQEGACGGGHLMKNSVRVITLYSIMSTIGSYLWLSKWGY